MTGVLPHANMNSRGEPGPYVRGYSAGVRGGLLHASRRDAVPV
jgi:hypothetical protein